MRLRLVASLAGSMGLLLTVALAPAASADCATDGLQWPDRPGILRGTVFSGEVVATGRTRLPSGSRYPSWEMRVDRVYAGQVSQVVTLVAVCAPITLAVGERYLVGAGAWSDDDPAQVGLNDQTSAAWRIRGASASLVSFGSENPAPAWLAAPGTVAEVLDLIAPGLRGPLPPTNTEASGITGTSTPPGDASPLLVLGAVGGALAWLGRAGARGARLRRRPTRPAPGR